MSIDTETLTICPTCRGLVDPADPSLLYGFKQVEATGMGQSRETADGLGAHFHRRCFPGWPSYREAPRP